MTPADRAHLRISYLLEGVLSFAANLLFIGVFFYTTDVFHWGLVANLSLATCQGIVYIAAALNSQKLAKKIGNRRLLIATNLVLAAVSLIGVLVSIQWIVVAAIIAYVPLMALNWPVLESAVASNATAHEMSKRIGFYNLVWAGMGAAAVALQGTLIRIDPRIVFLLPMTVHIGVASIVWWNKTYGCASEPTAAAEPHLAPEPALLRQRTTALWLSRIALPSAYAVIYTVSALMPLLPEIKVLDQTSRTLVGSAWLASRWFMFWFLGATVFWHTRPRLLLFAAGIMGLSFMGLTLPLGYGVPWLIAAQITLGFSLGLIYTASLYFGMVLSEGSAEHAGYHEALVGLGQVLGPAAGAITQSRWPGSLTASVLAVSGLIALSTLAAIAASIKAHRQE